MENEPDKDEDILPPEGEAASDSTPSGTPLNERQVQILQKLKEIGSITRKGYAEMFGISVPTAARDLKELADKKLLRAKGPLGPGRRYELV